MPDRFRHRRYLIPFRSQLLPHIFTDVLVIGAGVAGMRAAVEAAGAGDVIILAKGDRDLSSTAWAQGGIAAASAADDSPQDHARDTIAAGAGLCDPEAVNALVTEGPLAIDELLTHGMRVDRQPDGSIAFGREGGHRRSRIIHTDGASTGPELVRCLRAWLMSRANIRLFDQCFALDLLTDDVRDSAAPAVRGAVTFHPRYGLQIIWARATILASGGSGRLFRETTNPPVATADGLAMAYRAGARLADLEFMQFHPTTLYVAGAGRLLISEAVRGEGAILTTADGCRFMPEYHDAAELAPRDVVSRAIVDQLARKGAMGVFLDARPIGERFLKRFPDLVRALHTFDIDPLNDLIPVSPSAHYMIGGVCTDLDGRTDLPGLFACGETATNGLHGANRLASNSLLEGLVFGRRTGHAAAHGARDPAAPPAPAGPAGPARIISEVALTDHAELDLVDVRSSLRSALWRNAGIERTRRKLEGALDMFALWGRYTMDMVFHDPAGWEVQNMLTIGSLLVRAAEARRETRGVHMRTDFPAPDPSFRSRFAWSVKSDSPERIGVPAEETVAEPLAG